jgi:hypothetical protein
VSINARMSLARLGLEGDELEIGMVTFRPPAEEGDDWACYCANPPWPYTARGRTGREAFARLLQWISKRRKVYR